MKKKHALLTVQFNGRTYRFYTVEQLRAAMDSVSTKTLTIERACEKLLEIEKDFSSIVESQPRKVVEADEVAS